MTEPHSNCNVNVSFRALVALGGDSVTNVPTLSEVRLALLAQLMAGSFAWTRRQPS